MINFEANNSCSTTTDYGADHCEFINVSGFNFFLAEIPLTSFIVTFAELSEDLRPQ